MESLRAARCVLQVALLIASVCMGHFAHASPLTITGSGATTVQNLFYNFTKTVNKPGIAVLYKAIGSGEGRRQFIASVTHFCSSDVPFSPAEERQLAGYVKFTLPVAIQTISIFTVIPGKPILKLSSDLLSSIFQRQITTWDDPRILALNPSFKPPKGQAINVCVRRDKSGSTQLVTTFLAMVASSSWKLGASPLPDWPAGVLKGNGTARLIAKMQFWNWSIGYAGTSTGRRAKGLQEVMIKNKAGNWITAEQADVFAALPRLLPSSTGSWSAVSLLLNSGPQTWPITSFAYVFARQNQVQNGNQGGLLYAWLKFLMSAEAQTIIMEFNLVPVPATVIAKNMKAINSMIMSPMAKVPTLG